MIQKNQEDKCRFSNRLNVLAGLLIGGLTGAVTMLLLVPQSGAGIRTRIRQGGLELQDRLTDTIADLVLLTRYDNRQIPASIHATTRYGHIQMPEIQGTNA
jgi:gas vesicle protein